MHEPTVQTKLAHFPLLRQPVSAQAEEGEQVGLAAVQREPAVQLACRVGDDSCAGAHAESLNRTAVQTAPDTLLRLQRRYGNRFVQRVVTLFRQGEGEADVAPEVEQTIQSARGGGQPLDSTVRAQMEPAFGANFGGVRVHTNHQADSLNHSLSARAFTTGQDIFFKQGEYRPGTSGGRELLAHELTHVVQQNGDQVQTKLTVGAPGDQYEQEADQVARSIIQREGMGQQAVTAEEEEDKTSLQPKPDQAQRQIEDDEDEPIRRSPYRSPALLMRSQLRTASPVGRSRQSIQRKVDTSGGEWDTEQYDLRQDKDPSGTTFPAASGVRGVDVKLKFTPKGNVDAELIGLTQTAQSVIGNTNPYLSTPDRRGRAIGATDAANINTGTGETDQGSMIDRADARNNPIYGSSSLGSGQTLKDTPIDNNSTGNPAKVGNPNLPGGANTTYQLGYHYMSGTTRRVQDAKLFDGPTMGGASSNARQIFETTALAIKGAQAGTYYGSVRWGWRTDAAGNHTKIPLTVVSQGVPSSTFMKAAELWNAAKTSTGADTVNLPTVDVKVTTSPITGQYPPGFVGPPLQIPAGTRIQIIRNAVPPGTNGQIKVVDGVFTGNTMEVTPTDMANVRDERP